MMKFSETRVCSRLADTMGKAGVLNRDRSSSFHAFDVDHHGKQQLQSVDIRLIFASLTRCTGVLRKR